MNKPILTLAKPPEPNFTWYIGGKTSFGFTVPYTKVNRFKWWISTKLFLPGTYEWKKK